MEYLNGLKVFNPLLLSYSLNSNAEYKNTKLLVILNLIIKINTQLCFIKYSIFNYDF